jgi:polar amino acid transport system substrate-binding protein
MEVAGRQSGEVAERTQKFNWEKKMKNFKQNLATAKVHADLAMIVVAMTCLIAGMPAAQAKTQAPSRIAQSGTITYCMDISFPPFEFYDASTNEPTGFDVDLGKAVAEELGVKAEFKNISFDGLIPALQAGQCDAIISGLFDKPARREVLNLIDYANVGNSVIVKSDSSLHVDKLVELSGHSVAVESGSTLEQDIDQANDAAVKAGQPPIKIAALPKASDAYQQLMTGLVEAYYGSTAQEAYFNSQNPGSVKLASPQTSTFLTGIGIPKSDAEMTKAIQTAFTAIQANGQYDAVVKKWDFDSMTHKADQ